MRLDALLFQSGYFPSRTKAVEAINKNQVLLNGKPTKASASVDSLDGVVVLSEANRFVSNGGYKLQKAIDDFGLNLNGLSFADIGASNGGFTDCLLQSGVEKVIAVDVGENQLEKVLIDTGKVKILDNTNARYLNKEVLGELVDGVTADVSFISLTYILDGVKNILKPDGIAVLLIKPQFECGKEYLNKNGSVKDVSARKNAVKKVYNACYEKGLFAVNFTIAPIKDNKNVEYLILLTNNNDGKIMSINDILKKI